jgi:hypothetical protein
LENKAIKKILLIADTFFPEKNSAALMLHSLAKHINNKQIDLIVLTPHDNFKKKIIIYKEDGYNHIKFYCPFLKSKNLVLRTFGEFILSKVFIENTKSIKNSFTDVSFIISYAPTIFFGPFIKYLKKEFDIKKSYLILRDIFPQWIIDLKMINIRNPVYLIFKHFEKNLYLNSTKIGIQSKKNSEYFHSEIYKKKIEYLPNWYQNDITSEKTNLFKNINFKYKIIYTGKLSFAQNLKSFQLFLNLISQIPDACFIYIGNSFEKIKTANNIFSFNSVSQEQLQYLLSKSDLGIINLDKRHTTHNVPGKSLNYLANGLPILASLNVNNDFIDAINKNKIGYATSLELFEDNNILHEIKNIFENYEEYSLNAKKYIYEKHSVKDVFDIIKDI